MQQVCTTNGTYECAKILGQQLSARKQLKAKHEQNAIKRAEKKAFNERKENIKGRSYWLKKCEEACNSFIRARDLGQECISCDTVLGREMYHAGHYRSVGSAPHMRYNELNINGQCIQCNYHKAGNVIPYRVKLVKKIGVEAVEKLESDNSVKKYTIDELKELTLSFRRKLKELK